MTKADDGVGRRYLGENRIAAWLAREIRAAGFHDNAEFARRLGVANQVVWRWTNAKQRPSPFWCERIADVLATPLDRVLELAGYRLGLDQDDDESLAAVVCRYARSVRWTEERVAAARALFESFRAADHASPRHA